MRRDVKSVQIVVGRAKPQAIGRGSKLSSHLIPHKKVSMHTGNLRQLAYVGFSFLEFSVRLTILLLISLLTISFPTTHKKSNQLFGKLLTVIYPTLATQNLSQHVVSLLLMAIANKSRMSHELTIKTVS